MNSPIISILVPTRGRPALARRFLRSVAAQTRYLSQVEVILYIDDDDSGSQTIDSEQVCVTRIIGAMTSMGIANSRCLAAARGHIMILANDDVVIGTRGWDDRLIELDASIPDKIYLAYCNDLFKKKSLPTFPILSRRTCELLIQPFPEEYQGAFIDCHLFDVFQRLRHAGFDRIRYLDDVIFEHLHYRTGKAPFDETYRKRRRFADDPVFLELIESRKASASRLLRVLRDAQADSTKTESAGIHGSRTAWPQSSAATISVFSRAFLLDRELPLRWRFHLWCSFIARFAASRAIPETRDIQTTSSVPYAGNNAMPVPDTMAAACVRPSPHDEGDCIPCGQGAQLADGAQGRNQ